MRRWLPFLTLPVLALAAIWGSAIGVIQLRQAVSRSQDLYRLDTVGSQIESDLEFETQESRRAFLFALVATSPNQRLPFVNATHEADHDVRGTILRFQDLRPPESINRSIQDFEISWNAYTRRREDILAGIPAGDLKGAMEANQQPATETFPAVLGNLHALKWALEDHARAQSSRVDQTLKHCIVGLTLFVAATFVIISALLRMARARAVAAGALHSTNLELQHAQEMDQRRVAILEMVGTLAPLGQTLTAIAGLPAWHQRGAGAAVWSAAGNTLLYQTSSGLPEQVTNPLRSQSLERFEGRLNLGADARRRIAKLAIQANLSETIVPLQNATGDAIGLLLIFVPEAAPSGAEVLKGTTPLETRGAWGRISAQMAQLASLAIENTMLYERLAFQAQHDVLTGLPNRLLFQDRVQQAILRAQRNRRKVAVLWFDLDRFKQINDTLGHRIGDELLCEFGRRLKSSIRESDTAARIGGDEFVVLAADLDGATDFQVVVEKLMKHIRLSMSVSGHDLKISASAGISVYPDHGLEPAVLMRNADLAMYQAKRAGRNTFHVFQKELSDSLGRQSEIEQELRTAVENAEFHLEYQPLIGRHDELSGLEALLRWTNPKLGSVSPAEFIPIAEEAGLILRIGEWVTRAACRDGARWMTEGIPVPSIAVNASGLQFADSKFAEMVRTALSESGFPASKLEIEVTETALVGNLESAMQQIVGLRKLGIKFSIDDFGTGYSSLNQLRTLPVDCVKVDRSFIKDLERSSGDSTTLVRGIIEMAHNLRLDVVAEGVETIGQLAILRSLGCDISQGYYLHRPLTIAAVEALMRAYATKQHPAFSGDARTEPAHVLPDLLPESSLA
jgi:diguanylate cyclase (GGDEF)-like protein